ncbi:MAG: ABC transporter substrate-binding protein [Huintestinicola sp.]
MNTKIFKKLIPLTLSSALTLSLISGCAASSADNVTDSSGNELQTLRVAIMTGQPDQYTTFIGTEEGIFEKYGIKLETTEYVAGINTIDAVVNGTADTGEMADYALVNRIGNTLHDTNLVIFSELGASDILTGGLYVAPEFENNLAALDGSKGFISMVGTVSDYYTSIAIEKLGLDESKQNIINADYSTTLAIAQKNDASAVVAFGTNGSKYEEYGWKLAVSASDWGLKTGSYLLTTSEFSKNNSELLGNYLKATQESIDYINNNLDSVASRLAAKYGVVEENFKNDWTSKTFGIGASQDGADYLNSIEKWAFEHEKFPEDYSVIDFYDTSAIDAAFPERNTLNK